ncbi:hypothetical protein T492DRAFT_836844 [Pavlovales sp. CCMP2436]|nr:hypothetical protein T492DRAFT_836844 [Pavlovales sp. CCMP2436]
MSALPDECLSITPCVSVSSTVRADVLCAKGGFANLAQLFRPLGDELRDLPASVQTAALCVPTVWYPILQVGEPYTIRGLRVRVVAAADLKRISPAEAESRLIRAVAAHDSEQLWKCSPGQDGEFGLQLGGIPGGISRPGTLGCIRALGRTIVTFLVFVAWFQRVQSWTADCSEISGRGG